MVNNKYNFDISGRVLTFALMLLFSGCLPKDPCVYQFVIPLQLSPAIDTFHVGDTIWIESHFSTTMLDKTTGQYFSLNHPIFNTLMTFSDIGTNPLVSANNLFDITVNQGALQLITFENSSTYQVEYAPDSTGEFNLKLKIVPLRNGLFSFNLTSFTDRMVEYLDVTIIDGCVPSLAKYFYGMNNGEENNFYLNQFSPDTRIQTLGRDIFDESGQYNFVVVD